MANTDLNIILKLIDEASSGIKKVMKETGEETDKLKNIQKKANDEGEKGTTKHKKALEEARKAVQGFRREMFVLGLAIGTAGLVLKEYGKHNEEARRQVESFEIALAKLKITAGAVISEFMKNKNFSVLDVFGPLGQIIKALKNARESGGLDSVLGKVENIQRAVGILEKFNNSLKETDLLFQTNQISAKEYYDKILESSSSVIGQNQQIANDLKSLAIIQSEVGNKQLLETRTRIAEQIDLLNFYKETFQKAHAGMAAFTVTVGNAIQTNLSNALTGIITGVKTAKDAFAELGRMMIQTIVDFMVQKLIAFTLEKTLLAGTVAATSAAAATLAGAWAPAAFLATVATLGAAAAQAPASLAAAGAATTSVLIGVGAALKAGITGGGVGGFAKGTPNVPEDMFTQVHKNEIIVPASFAEGIRRGDLSLSGGANGSSNTIEVNIYYPKMSKTEEVRELASVLGLEIEKQMRYARGI